MNTVIAMIGALVAGILLGMWIGKHPDDARTYGEAAWARIQALFHKKAP